MAIFSELLPLVMTALQPHLAFEAESHVEWFEGVQMTIEAPPSSGWRNDLCIATGVRDSSQTTRTPLGFLHPPMTRASRPAYRG
jgi:hypothetical protein